MPFNKSINIFLIEIRERYRYALITNENNKVEIIISKKEYLKFQQEFFIWIINNNYKILLLNYNEQVCNFIIAKLVENELKYIQIDLLFNYSIVGINLFNINDILDKRVIKEGVYQVSLTDIFSEKHSLIYKRKSINLEYHQKIPDKKLLMKVFFSNLLTTPINQMSLSSKFIYCYIKGIVRPSGFSFSMTGPDGSGKTTLLTQLEDMFSKIYREVELHHFRPTVIPRIAELFKKSGLKKEVDENYDKPHRGGKTGKLSSWFRLFYYILDYIIGYYKIVKPVLFRRGIIIFDRYYTDIISDSKRSRIYLNYKTIFSLRFLVPKMNYNFIISVEPEKILQRKQELTREQIDDIYEKLNYISSKDKNYKMINNDNDPQNAVNEIIDFILEKQDEKYRKFFN